MTQVVTLDMDDVIQLRLISSDLIRALHEIDMTLRIGLFVLILIVVMLAIIAIKR